MDADRQIASLRALQKQVTKRRGQDQQSSVAVPAEQLLDVLALAEAPSLAYQARIFDLEAQVERLRAQLSGLPSACLRGQTTDEVPAGWGRAASVAREKGIDYSYLTGLIKRGIVDGMRLETDENTHHASEWWVNVGDLNDYLEMTPADRRRYCREMAS